MIYNIGGLWLDFQGDNPYFKDRCGAFLRSGIGIRPEEIDIRITMKPYKDLKKPAGDLLDGLKDAALLRKKPPLEGYYLYTALVIVENNIRKRRSNPSILDASLDWDNIKIKYVPDETTRHYFENGTSVNWNQYSAFRMAGIAFRYRLIKKNGILIHSSSIEFEGKGLIFSAPSGTGKSTHVRLWKEMFKDKVTIVNEDRPAIRYIDGIPMICGTPWSGTSDNFSDKIVPLNGIVMLEQSPENSIERLSGPRVLQLLLPRCFLPYFDNGMMSESMDTLERLIKDVPVYLLKCRPDYEAVELVKKCLI